MTDITLVLKPLRPALLRGTQQTVDVLVAVQAPDTPAHVSSTRMPLHVSLVIDRSGSMGGRPLAEAKRCANFVIDRLGVADRVAIVGYDDEAGVEAPCQPAHNRSALHAAVARIQSGGCTNLHGGWLAGAECIAPHAAPRTLSRVILLSDGLANRGVVDREQIYAQCEALAQTGVTTSTYGLGSNFDESLMTGIARAGRGNAYYGQTAEDLMDPFEEEFSFLANLCARSLRVTFEPAAHVSVEVLNRGRRQEPGSVSLPDLAYEAEAWVLLRLTVESRATTGQPAGAVVPLLKVVAHFEKSDGTQSAVEAPTLQLPLLDPSAYNAVALDADVMAKLAEVEMAQLETCAREAALEGNWPQVEALLAQAEHATQASEWAQRTIGDLRKLLAQRDRQRISKEMAYSAMRKDRGLAARSGPDHQSRESVPSYIRQKSSQGKSDPTP